MATPANAGSYTPIAGMSQAIPAVPGYYVNGSAANGMTPAPAGYFVLGNGQVSPQVAPAGRYAPIPGMQGTIVLGDANNDGMVSQGELNVVLTNYWSNSPWVTLTNAEKLSNGTWQFVLTNATAWDFSVLTGTNLTGTNWSYLGVANPAYTFVDTNSVAGERFYRLRWP